MQRAIARAVRGHAERDRPQHIVALAPRECELAAWRCDLGVPDRLLGGQSLQPRVPPVDQVVRCEWKRYRQAYVYAAAQVVRSSRQTIVRLSAAHRWYESLVAAHVWLQT